MGTNLNYNIGPVAVPSTPQHWSVNDSNFSNTIASHPKPMPDASIRTMGHYVSNEASHVTRNPLKSTGSLWLKAEADTDTYFPGDKVMIRITVRAHDCNVEQLRVKFNKRDTVYRGDHHRRAPRERLLTRDYSEGGRFPMRDGEYIGVLTFTLPSYLQPSTAGNFEYYLSVQCYRGMSSKNLRARLPIKILHKQ